MNQAGRILKDQLQGNNGEETVLAMESLDHCAFSKVFKTEKKINFFLILSFQLSLQILKQTYNIVAQTPDSAGTATAFLTGVKLLIRAIGVDGRAVDCATTQSSKLDSILKQAHKAGKSVGIVTTARVIHGELISLYICLN